MIILTIRTDQPEAEIALYDKQKLLIKDTWQAHRLLAETIHLQIAKNLQIIRKHWTDVKGIIVYKGPGSFTGLRIGMSVANALADGLLIPIVGQSNTDWPQQGISSLLEGDNDKIALPYYGSPATITMPKK